MYVNLEGEVCVCVKMKMSMCVCACPGMVGEEKNLRKSSRLCHAASLVFLERHACRLFCLLSFPRHNMHAR